MSKRILVSSDPYEARAALMDGDRLVNLEVEHAAFEKRKGHIYRGRVTAIEPSLQAAFVNYGPQKEGFLPFDDVATRSLVELSGHARAQNRSGLRIGDTVLVQVSKEEVGRKGANLTMFVSLPGRYVVLMPFSERTGVSRKLDDDERVRLRRVMNHLKVPDGFGVILRTSGEMSDIAEIQADLDHLVETWNAIQKRFRESTEPGEVYSEPGLAVRFVRDYLSADVSEILVEDSKTEADLSRYLHVWMPHRQGLLKRYSGEIPLFMRYGVERQIEALLSRRVTLPSGGSIVIGETEALVAIDVNSGRMKQRDATEMILQTNLEAAREIARQVVLRDLGGIIVVDFIDMESEAHRAQVEQALRSALAQDKARLTFGRISEFGLLAFSRQRIRQAMESGITLPCPTCGGTGRVRSPSSLAMTALRRVRERLATLKEHAAFVEVVLPVPVANFLNNRKREDLIALEKRYGVVVDVTGDPDASPNDIRVNVLPEVPPDRSLLKSGEDLSTPPVETPRAPEASRAAVQEPRERSVLKGLLKMVFGLKDEPESGAGAGEVPASPASPASEPVVEPPSQAPVVEVAVPDAQERRSRRSRRRRSGRTSGSPGEPQAPAPGPAVSVPSGASAEPAAPSAPAALPAAEGQPEQPRARKRSRRRRSGRSPAASGAAAEAAAGPEIRKDGPRVAQPSASPTAEAGPAETEAPRRSRRRRGGRRRKEPREAPLPLFADGESPKTTES